MSFRARRKGFRLVEIPIVFVDRMEGQSKMNKKITAEQAEQLLNALEGGK